MPHYKKEMISFFLTTRCNLDCIYCYTNKQDHPIQTLSLDFAKYAIKEYFDSGYEKHIRFFGAGEPTTKPKLIQEIIDFSRNYSSQKVLSEIQTNGVFDEKIAKWLAENLDVIWISCDGVPEIQDYNRPLLRGGKSSEFVEKNIQYLTKQGLGMTGIRMTITSKNLDRQKECLQYFYDLGIRNIWCDPIFPSVGDSKAFDEIDLMKFAIELKDAKDYAEKLNVTYGSILTCNFDEKSIYHCRACIPVPHLTTDGYISACDMAMFGNLDGPMSVFIYGKWEEQRKEIIYDTDKIEALRSRKVENLKHCVGCSAINDCAGYCLGEVVNETGNLFGCKERVCEPIRFLNSNLTEAQKKYKFTHP